MNAVAALLYAVCSSVLVALVLAIGQGGLSSFSAGAALGVGALVAACSLWRRRQGNATDAPPSIWEWGAVGIFALASARAFLWLVFVDGDAIKVLSPNNLGDLSLHLTYINYLASGVPFWPENPIFAHGQLTYPVGVDLFNALLVLAGVDPLRGLIWVGLGGATLTGLALWRWGRGVAIAAFVANGGVAGFAFFGTGQFIDFQADFGWKSLFLAIFVTQRGLLFALPAGLLLLTSWRARYFGVGEKSAQLPRWGELLLYAAMPVFHLHTFIFLSLLLGSWFVLHAPARRELFRFVGFAALPATLLVLLVTGNLQGASVLGFKPGWMWDDPAWLKWCESYLPGPAKFNAALLFWPVNFGCALPLVLGLGTRLAQDQRAVWPRAIFFPSLFIFLLCCFVKFAPWEWDNTKIMLWSWLAIVPLGWQELLQSRPLWQRALAAFLLFWSGFASLIGGLNGKHTGYEIARRSELDGVVKAVAALPLDARFVAYPTYNHPLLLAGRKVALGYPGHAWSHGLDWQGPAAQVEALMNGEEDWDAFATDLGVEYLFWGAAEAEHYKASKQPWKDSRAHVASGTWGDIYYLLSPAASEQAVPGDPPP
ncbi:MAG: hypothetical protein QOE70_628 [Chthoniobacter sp.]|jgi:hypothetical protein|nr:hypothetical protein [Chthoniobacter sp.]